jgi:hypothetical protein
VRCTHFLAAFLLAAPLVRAQSTANTLTAQAAQAQVLRKAQTACPVGFYAGHSNSLTQLRAEDAKPGVVSQSLNLRMSNATGHDIVSAKITLHGLSPRYRLSPLTAETAPTGDLSKQVDFDLSVDSGKQAATDLRVFGFTSVQRIDLDSLTYADGTTWTASAQHRCSVIPNGMMLVASAQ